MDGNEEEEDSDNNRPLTGAPGITPLHNPSPTLPNVDDLQGRGLFPPRTRNLAGPETWGYGAAIAFLQESDIQKMYGSGLKIIESILDSDAFPLSLVGYAMDKTYQRNRMYPEPLGNPAAYTIRLLNDWKAQGFKTPEDVQESKDDWMHFG